MTFETFFVKGTRQKEVLVPPKPNLHRFHTEENEIIKSGSLKIKKNDKGPN